MVISVFAIMPAMASAYTIDGSIADWGVDISAGLAGTDSAWQSTSSTVDWIVEDNIDPTYNNDVAYPDWTGYDDTGTHIQKSGDTYITYQEPFLPSSDWWANLFGGHYLQPVGGEHYDIEALYFDDDAQYAYIAIVTSMGPNGYEYGIKTHGNDKGMIRYSPDWSLPQASDDFIVNAPSEFKTNTGTLMGTAELVYTNINIDETVDLPIGNFVT